MTAPASAYPILPLRDIVVFPGMVVPLFVGRDKSVRALESVVKTDNRILLASQKNGSQDETTQEDIFLVGTVATVLQLLRLPDGTVKVLVEVWSAPKSPATAKIPIFMKPMWKY